MVRITQADYNGEIMLIKEYTAQNRLTHNIFQALTWDIEYFDDSRLGYKLPYTFKIETDKSVILLCVDILEFEDGKYAYYTEYPYTSPLRNIRVKHLSKYF